MSESWKSIEDKTLIDRSGSVQPARFSDIALHSVFQDFEELLDTAGDKAFDEVIEDSDIYLSVDLTATNTALKKAFLDVIKKYRKLKGIPNPTKKETEKNLTKIRQYMVLPFLDLKNWEELTNTKITARAVTAALYPSDPVKDEKFVRDTLPDWAKRAQEPGLIASIRAL